MAFAPGDSIVPVFPPPAAPAPSAAEDGSNPLLELAWQFVEETDAHLFLTGRAGTGKTTFLRRLRESCPKRMVVAAPTGVAAINAGGVTLHSFFQLPLGPFIPGAQYEGQRRFRMPQAKRDLIRSMDLLVIDEISMVRADLLDAVDDALRRFRDPTRPFGGVQLLLIGDLQQLPPVVTRDEQELFAAHYSTPYFFSSRALAAIDLVTIELHHVYRQSADPAFLSILNAIRSGSPSSADLVALNARVDPAFRPPPAAGYIRLTSHNALADAVNARELDALPSPPATYRAALDGDFPETSLPTDRHLVLKPGAQVMFVKNDPGPDHRFYNGLIGTVRATAAASVTVDVPGQSAPIRVEPLAWENKKYSLDPDTKAIVEEVQGTFRQLPLRLAWAVTIHKSQGLTFDHVIIDAARSFAHGQVYVALSRCRTLAGIVLASPISTRNLVADPAIAAFLEQVAASSPPAALPALRLRYRRSLLHELFDFAPLEKALGLLAWSLREHFSATYPALVQTAAATLDPFRNDILRPADKFLALIDAKSSDALLAAPFLARVTAGAAYFLEHLAALLDPWLPEAAAVQTDSKEAAARHRRLLDALTNLLHVRLATLRYAAATTPDAPFDVSAYLATRQTALLETIDAPADKSRRHPLPPRRGGARGGEASAATPDDSAPFGQSTDAISRDIAHPALLSQLRSWRAQKARDLHLPAYCVLQQKAMHALANTLPLTPEALANTPNFGRRTFDHYAAELLPLLRDFAATHSLLPPDLPPLPPYLASPSPHSSPSPPSAPTLF